jgi:hypothetical protein
MKAIALFALLLALASAAAIATDPSGLDHCRQLGLTAQHAPEWRDLASRLEAANALYAGDTLEAWDRYWLISSDANATIAKISRYPLPDTTLIDALRLIGVLARRNASLNGWGLRIFGHAGTIEIQDRVVARQNRMAALLDSANALARHDPACATDLRRAVARAADQLADSLKDTRSLISYQLVDALRMTAIQARHHRSPAHYTVIRRESSAEFLRLRDTLDAANRSYERGDLGSAERGYQEVTGSADEELARADSLQLVSRAPRHLLARLLQAAEGNLAILRWRPFVEAYNNLSDSLNQTNAQLRGGSPFVAARSYGAIALATDSLVAAIDLAQRVIEGAPDREGSASVNRLRELRAASANLYQTALDNRWAAQTRVPDYCREILARAQRPGATSAEFSLLVNLDADLGTILADPDLNADLAEVVLSLRRAVREVLEHRFGLSGVDE